MSEEFIKPEGSNLTSVLLTTYYVWVVMGPHKKNFTPFFLISSVWNRCSLCIYLKLIFIGVQLIYNVVLVVCYAANRISYTYIQLLFRSSSHIDHYRILSRVPCAIR